MLDEESNKSLDEMPNEDLRDTLIIDRLKENMSHFRFGKSAFKMKNLSTADFCFSPYNLADIILAQIRVNIFDKI